MIKIKSLGKRKITRQILVFLNVFILLSIIMILKGGIAGYAVKDSLSVEISDYEVDLEDDIENDNIGEIFLESENKLDFIDIQNIEVLENKLNISYVFDNSGFIGGETSIEIWAVNNGIEIERVIDIFPINKDGLINRGIIMEIPDDLSGILDVYFALSSDLENYSKTSIDLRESLITGNVALDLNKGKVFSYFFIIALVLIILFFTVKSYLKKGKKPGNEKSKNKKMIRKRK